ncbi:NF038130 family PEP-CTERM protein [Okeania sp. SIO2B3]|uniref:NF038130 family PEP-CTERM protein n=1 Tax=Okeania sp. SIO2B3 TaxID=2607784 RepID=UPI0013BF1E40|nr:NF038130 family PEP-CTERM protein [Okeania sp. SIO2B3]NET46280.1 PEP-CTERM sorting domain-containing protein [Okeania sp. SIO2B3]
MAGLVKKFLASASVVASMSAVFGAPAMAATFTSSGTDIILREQVGTSLQVTNDITKLDSILQGDSSNPGGNVELGAKNVGQTQGANPLATVQAQNAQGETAKFTNVTENIYSSSDWLNGVGRAWFSDAWEQAVERNSSAPLVSSATEGLFYSIFIDEGGLDMITDPNISYINEVGDDIVVGLASPLNLGDRFSDPFLAGALDGVQISEIFAYDINGVTGYAWSTVATETGLGGSFSGNYEVVLEGLANGYVSQEVLESSPEDIPEPSTVLGLIAIGGLVAATKRKVQK